MSRLRWMYAGLFGLAVLSFAPTIPAGFMWDDHVMIEGNKSIQRIGAATLKEAFSDDVFDGNGNEYYRPLQTVMNMIDFKIWGLNPVGFHLTNLLFHAASALLLFAIFAQFFERQLAFITAAFFAVHPIVVEQLLIIAGRAELMSLMFMLLAIYLALLKKPWALVVAACAYACACLSKESGVVFPALLFLLGWFDKKARVPKVAYIGFAVVLVMFLILRRMGVAEEIFFTPKEFFISMFRDMPTIFLEYVRILLFPIDLHSHRRMEFKLPFMYLSPVFFVLAGVIAWRHRSRLAAFSAAWFLAGMAPKIPALITNSLMLDHWGYISGIGVYLLLANAVQRRRLVCAGIILFWVGLSWHSALQRNSDKKLYAQALRYPTSSTVRANLALIYLQEGNMAEAKPLVEQALRLNPDHALARTLEKIISSSPQN
jgi:protein O-mannosyl-transferase